MLSHRQLTDRSLAVPAFYNPHWEALTAEFGPPNPDVDASIPDFNYLFILFTNRCGSNFLAQVLASTGRFNEAGEFFNSDVILGHARDKELRSIQEYLSVLVRMVGLNGRLTAKLTIDNIDVLVQAGIMKAILPRSRFLLLERQNQLNQAISRVIAWQNLCWTTKHSKRIQDSALVYSRKSIQEEMSEIQAGNARLYSFLREAGVTPIHFAYEHLVDRPQEHLDVVTSCLGLPHLTFAPDRVQIGRQAGPVNAVWRARYLEETRHSPF